MFDNKEIVINPGIKGLTGTRAPVRYGPDYLSKAENVVYENEVIVKEGGSSKYSSTTQEYEISGAFDWWPTPSIQRLIIALRDGPVLMDTGDGSFSNTVKNYFVIGEDVPIFVPGGSDTRKLFLICPTRLIQVISGTDLVASDISTPPADWATSNFPNCGCIHENRLWVASGHRIYYSTVADHEDFQGDGSGSIPIYNNVGNEIMALISFKGALIVYKRPRGIFLVDTSNSDITKWRVNIISEAIGTAGPRCVTPIENDVLHIDVNGYIYLVSAVDQFGNLGVRDLTRIDEVYEILRTEVDLDRLRYSQVIFYANKGHVHISVASPGRGYNDKRLIIDLRFKDIARFSISTKNVCSCLFLRQVNYIERPFCGDIEGYIWNLDIRELNKQGSPYTGVFTTLETDFSYIDAKFGGIWKNLKFIEIESYSDGDWRLIIEVYADRKLIDTIVFTPKFTGAVLNSTFILDNATLSEGGTRVIRRRAKGGGRSFSFKVYNEEINQGFEIPRIRILLSTGSSEDPKE